VIGSIAAPVAGFKAELANKNNYMEFYRILGKKESDGEWRVGTDDFGGNYSR